MTTLVFDFGNTFSKASVFKNQKAAREFKIRTHELNDKFISDILHKNKYDKLTYVSVIQLPADISKSIETIGSYIPFMLKNVPGLKSKYKSLQTLGSDRLAAALGSQQRFSSKNSLTIICGSCITYNFVNTKNEFLGGAISPGLNMRLHAMHQLTDKLPLVALNSKIDILGKDTTASLQSGAFWGAVSEIDGVIDRYKSKYKSLIVIMSGGDASILQRRLKNKIFAIPDLVLKGLNYYLQLNDKNF